MRPRVVVNVAMSVDGKLSTRERRQVRISGPSDLVRVDRLKASSDAVMVGIGTVLADNPSLTVKSKDLIAARIDQGKSPHPVRIIIDSRARTPPDADILFKGEGKRLIAVGKDADEGRIRALSPLAGIFRSETRDVDLTALMSYLYDLGVRSVMVEGGGTLIASLFSCDLVDEVRICIGSIVIGGRDAPTLADGPGFTDENLFPRLRLMGCEPVDEGVLIRWTVLRP